MKRTVPQLADFLSQLTGESEATHQQQARKAREAGYLSQAGHGRGAAAATPMDAAMLLLISAVGLTARYTDVVASALDVTKPDYGQAESLKIGGENAVEMLASLIERRLGGVRVDVLGGGGLQVNFWDIEPGSQAVIACRLSEKSPAGKRFSKVLNRTPISRPGFRRETSVEPWVFEEIADYLGIESDEDAS
jgi:hypothetical protein